VFTKIVQGGALKVLKKSTFLLVLRLNQMLYYDLGLLYHSNTEAVLSRRLSSGWVTTTGRLLGPQDGK